MYCLWWRINVDTTISNRRLKSIANIGILSSFFYVHVCDVCRLRNMCRPSPNYNRLFSTRQYSRRWVCTTTGWIWDITRTKSNICSSRYPICIDRCFQSPKERRYSKPPWSRWLYRPTWFFGDEKTSIPKHFWERNWSTWTIKLSIPESNPVRLFRHLHWLFWVDRNDNYHRNKCRWLLPHTSMRCPTLF